ncbi:MAG: TRAP transporter substrate-binding protein [Gammaproteobacteria bacterium]|nr:TRAP transporter substrate-binding protein [Gammaproteobacteria bacterium]NNL50715.1 TRAP transporter substrate-binding protein [Woeseiaceae bacterium]
MSVRFRSGSIARLGRGAGLIVFAACVILSGGCERQSDVKVLTLAHNLDTGHTVHKAMLLMGERLEAYSDGQLAIAIYPGGQLGSERENLELLQIGSLAMTKVSASPLEGFVPELKVFNLPYIFANREHHLRVLDSPIGKGLLESLQVARLYGLGYYDAGSRSFYTSDRPVNSPEDLRGMKIRVMKSQTAVRMVTELGGSPTPISLGEIYTALQQGVVDGAENNAPSFYRLRHYEAARYYSLDEHTFVPDVLIMSKRIWDDLTANEQEWLSQAVDDSVKYQRELWLAETDASLAAVADAGVTISYPDKEPFRAAVQAMKGGFEGTRTGEILRAIEEME